MTGRRKKTIKKHRILLLLILFLLYGIRVYGAVPQAHLTEKAGLLRREEAKQLNMLLADFEQQTGNQFIVVTVPALPAGESLELYSLKLAETAKAGQKGDDNGLLLLIVAAERKIRLEVGTGLEEKITDGRAGRVIREVITPAFQKEEYFLGLQTALITLINWVDSSYFPAGSPEAEIHLAEGLGFSFYLLLFFLMLIFSFYYSRFERRRLYKKGYSQKTILFPNTRYKNVRSTPNIRKIGSGFRGGGGGFRGGGASGGW